MGKGAVVLREVTYLLSEAYADTNALAARFWGQTDQKGLVNRMHDSSSHEISPHAFDRIRCDGNMAKELEKSYYDELLAISDYMYQSIVTERTKPHLSALFSDIAMDEMRHFRTVGRLIFAMGHNPSIQMKIRQSVPTDRELCDDSESALRRQIRKNLIDEKAAYHEYLRLAQSTCDGAVHDILCRIAADERRHERALADAYDAL